VGCFHPNSCLGKKKGEGRETGPRWQAGERIRGSGSRLREGKAAGVKASKKIEEGNLRGSEEEDEGNITAMGVGHWARAHRARFMGGVGSQGRPGRDLFTGVPEGRDPRKDSK